MHSLPVSEDGACNSSIKRGNAKAAASPQLGAAYLEELRDGSPGHGRVILARPVSTAANHARRDVCVHVWILASSMQGP